MAESRLSQALRLNHTRPPLRGLWWTKAKLKGEDVTGGSSLLTICGMRESIHARTHAHATVLSFSQRLHFSFARCASRHLERARPRPAPACAGHTWFRVPVHCASAAAAHSRAAPQTPAQQCIACTAPALTATRSVATRGAITVAVVRSPACRRPRTRRCAAPAQVCSSSALQ